MRERSAAAAQVVANNAFWIDQLAQQTLRRVDAAIGANALDQERLDLVLEGLPSRAELYIVDENGRALFSTVGGADKVSVADRDYFRQVQDGAAFGLSSLIISRLTGESIFVFSKRIERNGAFVGAATLSFPAAIVRDFWAMLEFEDASTVSLIRNDGKLIARYPPPDGEVDLSPQPIFTQYLPASPVGTYTSPVSPVDGVARVVSYRRVEGTQIIALAAISSQEVWNTFQAGVRAVFLIVSPIILGLVGGSIWIVRLLYRDAARERELEAAVEANNLLFREIHHRVKNNLQSVQSLVSLQEMPEGAKQDLRSRLAAMAAMHTHIYEFDSFNEIDAHDYVPSVVNEVVTAYGAPVKIIYDLEHLHVDRDHATPLALLLSELVTNSIKYAFNDLPSGEISVSIKACGPGRADLVVSDNGVGLDTGEVMPGMGTRLLRGVVAQMAGTYSITSEQGARFSANIALETKGHSVQQTPSTN
ncbi:MAG TPA: histidine kinase dimerization/phosphoacceptor domain -containing protein [Devosia sp.]